MVSGGNETSGESEAAVRVDVVLPAGGRLKGRFADETGAEVKALIRFGGQTVLERTLSTLRATGRVERAVVIGPEEIAAHPASRTADAVLPERYSSGPSNILRGIEWLRETDGGRYAERVLIVATDLPYLTPDSLTSFLDCCPPGMDICVPLVNRGEFEVRYPGTRNKYVRLRDGEWTMGCAFLVNPRAVAANRALMERVFSARKSQLGMARLLGPGIIARFLTRRLTVDHVANRCRQILGCTAGGITGSAPELAFDIDRPEEYRYAAGSALRD